MCNTVEDPFVRISVPNKTKGANLKYSIKNIESKTLTKHISCEFRCKFDDRNCNSKQKWNNDLSQCECKKPINHRVCRKDYA